MNADRTWIIGDHSVALNADTKIINAVIAGQFVKVVAALLSDGTLLALEIKAEAEQPRVDQMTRLDGTFDGIDDAGRWIISGTPAIVDEDTDTDGLPYIGQRVRVKALVQEDGSLLAREIENIGGRHRTDDDKDNAHDEVKLEGILQSIGDDGVWIVGGTRMVVDSSTKMEGSPTVGQFVEVKGIRQEDGSVLALKVEGGRTKRSRIRTEARWRFVEWWRRYLPTAPWWSTATSSASVRSWNPRATSRSAPSWKSRRSCSPTERWWRVRWR